MDCQRVVELLPWLVNGRLDDEEQRQVRSHLARCQPCQQELDQTVLAVAVYDQHVPSEALVDYAFRRPTETIKRDLIEQHLQSCDACADEFSLVRKNYRLAEASEEVRLPAEEKSREWLSLRWSYITPLAGLTALVAVVSLWSWQRARLADQQALVQARMAQLEQLNKRLQDQARLEIARLTEKVKALSAPQVNIPIFDLYPTGFLRRAGQPTINELQIPRDIQAVTLILNAQTQTTYRNFSLEIIDAQKKIVWGHDGLLRQAAGNYTINLSTELLKPGGYTFIIYGVTSGARRKIEIYPIRVVRT